MGTDIEALRETVDNQDRCWRPRRGMAVRVKSPEAVAATLDAQHRSAGLPFQPEMWQYCGHTFTIAQVVNRIYIEKGTVRKLLNTVLLQDVRCDGQAHRGCQRGCLLLFHVDWLQPADSESAGVADTPMRQAGAVMQEHPCQGQASVLMEASSPLPFWDLRQYIADLTTRRMGLWDLLRMFGYMLLFRARRGKPYRPRAISDAVRAGAPPPAVLDLRPGEWVEVRSADEIAATLDDQGKCRGLYFSAEGMAPYCGKRFRVAHPVETMIDEVSERRVSLKHTVVLEGVTCDGIGLRGCPRRCYWLWREGWLKRIAR